MTMHHSISIIITLLAALLISCNVVDAQFICYICGDAEATFSPDIVLEAPITCEQVQELGLAGEILEEDCIALVEEFNTPELCECSNVATPVPAPVTVPVNVPVTVPVDVPSDIPVDAPVDAPVPVPAPVVPTVGGLGMNNNQMMAMGMMGMGNMRGMGMMALLRHARH